MTTIACDLSVMAGDSQLTDEVCKSHCRKVWKHKGVCIGVAGTYHECTEFISWYRGGMKGDLPNMTDVHALMLTKDGIWLFDGTAKPYKLTDRFMAIGSGAQAALAAMHMGAGPKEAVGIASMVDAYTGGQIQTRKLKKD